MQARTAAGRHIYKVLYSPARYVLRRFTDIPVLPQRLRCPCQGTLRGSPGQSLGRGTGSLHGHKESPAFVDAVFAKAAARTCKSLIAKSQRQPFANQQDTKRAQFLPGKTKRYGLPRSADTVAANLSPSESCCHLARSGELGSNQNWTHRKKLVQVACLSPYLLEKMAS